MPGAAAEIVESHGAVAELSGDRALILDLPVYDIRVRKVERHGAVRRGGLCPPVRDGLPVAAVHDPVRMMFVPPRDICEALALRTARRSRVRHVVRQLDVRRRRLPRREQLRLHPAAAAPHKDLLVQPGHLRDRGRVDVAVERQEQRHVGGGVSSCLRRSARRRLNSGSCACDHHRANGQHAPSKGRKLMAGIDEHDRADHITGADGCDSDDMPEMR